MKLLTPTPPSELPAEALLARLRCRRALIEPAPALAMEAPAEDVVCWVYRRLDSPLRKQLEAFLDLLAMRNLVLTLRYTLAGEVPPRAVSVDCLLARPLQQLATEPGEAQIKVARLEAALAGDYPFARGLAATCSNQGPGGVEQQLADGILQHGLARAGNRTLKMTLSYLVDMRNCLMIHKLWRWQVKRRPPLTSGGTLATFSLQRIWATHDSERLNRLIMRLAGEAPSSGKTVAMEQCLLNGLTRLLRRAGRDPLDLGVVIDYLWRAQLAMHNQLLRQTLAADRDELLAEVMLL